MSNNINIPKDDELLALDKILTYKEEYDIGIFIDSKIQIVEIRNYTLANKKLFMKCLNSSYTYKKLKVGTREFLIMRTKFFQYYTFGFYFEKLFIVFLGRNYKYPIELSKDGSVLPVRYYPDIKINHDIKIISNYYFYEDFFNSKKFNFYMNLALDKLKAFDLLFYNWIILNITIELHALTVSPYLEGYWGRAYEKTNLIRLAKHFDTTLNNKYDEECVYMTYLHEFCHFYIWYYKDKIDRRGFLSEFKTNYERIKARYSIGYMYSSPFEKQKYIKSNEHYCDMFALFLAGKLHKDDADMFKKYLIDYHI